MSKATKPLEVPSIVPVSGIVIEHGEPVQKEGVNTTFVAKSLGDTSVNVGYIEGVIEPGKYSDIDGMEIYDGWRGNHFGSQLFMHFIQHSLENDVKSISAGVANERVVRMMGNIPGVARYDFSFDNRPEGEYTIEQAEQYLADKRKEERPDDPDIDEMLGTTIRIDAHLQ